jgi:hypothetical protein
MIAPELPLNYLLKSVRGDICYLSHLYFTISKLIKWLTQMATWTLKSMRKLKKMSEN